MLLLVSTIHEFRALAFTGKSTFHLVKHNKTLGARETFLEIADKMRKHVAVAHFQDPCTFEPDDDYHGVDYRQMIQESETARQALVHRAKIGDVICTQFEVGLVVPYINVQNQIAKKTVWDMQDMRDIPDEIFDIVTHLQHTLDYTQAHTDFLRTHIYDDHLPVNVPQFPLYILMNA